MTTIDGLDVHFLHVKPDPKAAKGKKILPLLIVHGWPGKHNFSFKIFGSHNKQY